MPGDEKPNALVALMDVANKFGLYLNDLNAVDPDWDSVMDEIVDSLREAEEAFGKYLALFESAEKQEPRDHDKPAGPQVGQEGRAGFQLALVKGSDLRPGDHLETVVAGWQKIVGHAFEKRAVEDEYYEGTVYELTGGHQKWVGDHFLVMAALRWP